MIGEVGMIGIHHQFDKSLTAMLGMDQRRRACEVLREMTVTEMFAALNQAASEEDVRIFAICLLVKLTSFEPSHLSQHHACVAKKLFNIVLVRAFGEKVLSREGWRHFTLEHPYSDMWLTAVENRCMGRRSKR